MKTILEVFTFLFQRVKAWENEFGRVPSISFIFTGSKMARILMVYYTRFGKVNVNTAQWIEVGSHAGRSLIQILDNTMYCTYMSVRYVKTLVFGKTIIVLNCKKHMLLVCFELGSCTF